MTCIVWLIALGWVGQAEAACPEIDATLRSAESDVVSYFLADAQKALDEAVVGMGCGAVNSRQLARYWQTQGMVWMFEDDPRVDGAFAASRRDDADYFLADFGEDARARWEAARLPVGDGAPLVLKGMGPSETVWVDGRLLDGSAPLGLHVVQVGDATPRFAAVVPVEGVEPVMVVVPRLDSTGSPVPVPVGPVEAPVLPTFASPLTATGRRVVDANGRAMNWRRDVKPLAMRHGVGADALVKMRANTLRQVGSGALTAGGLYGTYLFGWELLRGKSREPGTMTTGLMISGLTGLVGALGFMKQRSDRKELREQVRLGAEMALVNE